MSKEDLISFIRSRQPTEKVNPYWSYDEQVIDNHTNKPLDLLAYEDVLYTAQNYFNLVWESFNTEAQVLVLTDESAQVLDSQITLPKLELEDPEFHVYVLPQTNTWSNTSISETFWQKYIIGNNIIPFMRIHSHHILDAYQSQTDWSTLNSSTLEVVIGHVTTEPMYAFWLDEYNKDTKDNVFQCEHVYSTPNKIRNGRPIMLDKI